MKLTPAQKDRAVGAMLGAACGDALGVPYEFGRRLTSADVPVMRGGGLGGYDPGQWSDDTEMSAVILDVASRRRLLSAKGLDDVATGFSAWLAGGPGDVGAQTASVLHATGSAVANWHRDAPVWRAWLTPRYSPAARLMSEAAQAHHKRSGRSGGNGSLMRTAPVALAYLGSRSKCAEAARKVSALTHHDPMAGDLCAVWCDAIRQAVLGGGYSLRKALDVIPAERRGEVAQVVAPAMTGTADVRRNGWVVTAFQAAVMANRVRGDYRAKVYAAVRFGDDTDTVAAIAGALAGAVHGASGIPPEYLGQVGGVGPHGRMTGASLRSLAEQVIGRA